MSKPNETDKRTPEPDEIFRALGVIRGELDAAPRLIDAQERAAKLNQEKERGVEGGKKGKKDSGEVIDLKKLYGHIESLVVEFYYIETRVPHYCPYCEAWKKNKIERKLIRKLPELLGLPEERVLFREMKCDWNCLTATKYFDESEQKYKEYPPDLDEWGYNWAYAYGLGIEYFPALRIRVQSTLFNTKKTISSVESGEDMFEGGIPDNRESKAPRRNIQSTLKTKKKQLTREFIFPALGRIVKKDQLYKIGEEDYWIERPVIELSILKPLLKFLRYLDMEKADMPIDERYSFMMGQYQKHISL